MSIKLLGKIKAVFPLVQSTFGQRSEEAIVESRAEVDAAWAVVCAVLSTYVVVVVTVVVVATYFVLGACNHFGVFCPWVLQPFCSCSQHHVF
jgi:hypothetical protein